MVHKLHVFWEFSQKGMHVGKEETDKITKKDT
jgi:hypothetical protein